MTGTEEPVGGQPADPGGELVDLVDEINRVVGQALRREVRSRNLLHRGVAILCRNRTGRLHVHKRTTTKDVFPGMYDMFVGGVVLAGESYPVAARREIEEELGIQGVEPEFLFAHLYLGDRNKSWIYVYQVTWDGPIRLQAEEVVWGEWVDWETLAAMTLKLPFVPDGLEVYSHLLDWQRSKAPGS